MDEKNHHLHKPVFIGGNDKKKDEPEKK